MVLVLCLEQAYIAQKKYETLLKQSNIFHQKLIRVAKTSSTLTKQVVVACYGNERVFKKDGILNETTTTAATTTTTTPKKWWHFPISRRSVQQMCVCVCVCACVEQRNGQFYAITQYNNTFTKYK